MHDVKPLCATVHPHTDMIFHMNFKIIVLILLLLLLFPES